MLGALIFLILMLLFLFFVKVKQTDPPYPQEEVVMIMDYSDNGGGGSSGGHEQIAEEEASSAKEQNSDTQESSEEQVATQEEESPVETPSHDTPSSSDGSGESTTNENPKYDFGNAFGHGGGENGGDGNGTDGNGDGNGSGPNIGDGYGDGEGRKVVKYPDFDNPTQEEGKVMVEVVIDRDGNVTKSKYLANHQYTNTSNLTLLKKAQEVAKQFKFDKNPTGAKLQVKRIQIKFTLN